MNCKYDYCLKSSESYVFKEQRRCWLLKKLNCDNRSDLALVKIDPPAVFRDSANNEVELTEIILASRFQEMNVFDFKDGPVYVYIATVNQKIEKNTFNIDPDNIKIIAWGELYPECIFPNNK